MILFTAVKAFAGLVVHTLMDSFINSFVNWLKEIPNILAGLIQGVLIGQKTYVSQDKNEAGLEVSKNYSRVGDRWQVTSATRSVSLDEIPDEIRRRMNGSEELDVTDELEMALQ